MISLFYIFMLVILVANAIYCQSSNHLYPFISDKFYINGKNIRFIGIPYYTDQEKNEFSSDYTKIMKQQVEEPYLTESRNVLNESLPNKPKIGTGKKYPFRRIGVYPNDDGYFGKSYFDEHTSDSSTFKENKNNPLELATHLTDSLKLPENLQLNSQLNSQFNSQLKSQTKVKDLKMDGKINSSVSKEAISRDIDYVVRLPFQENQK